MGTKAKARPRAANGKISIIRSKKFMGEIKNKKLRGDKKSSHLDDFEERKLSSLNYSTSVPNIKSLDFGQETTPNQPSVAEPTSAAENKDPPWLK